MDVTFKTGDAVDQQAGALVVPVAAGGFDGAAAPLLRDLDARLSGHLGALANDARFTGKAGSTLTVPTLGQLPATRLILVGVGAAERLTAASLTRSYGAAALAARDAGARSIAVALPAGTPLPETAAVEAAALGLLLATYEFTRYHGAAHASPRPEIDRATIVAEGVSTDAAEAALRRAAAVADGVALARDLVNEPASVLTPQRWPKQPPMSPEKRVSTSKCSMKRRWRNSAPTRSSRSAWAAPTNPD